MWWASGSLLTVSPTSLCFPWLQAFFSPFGSASGIPANSFPQPLLNRNLFAEWLRLEISPMGRIQPLEIRPGNFPGLLLGQGQVKWGGLLHVPICFSLPLNVPERAVPDLWSCPLAKQERNQDFLVVPQKRMPQGAC